MVPAKAPILTLAVGAQSVFEAGADCDIGCGAGGCSAGCTAAAIAFLLKMILDRDSSAWAEVPQEGSEPNLCTGIGASQEEMRTPSLDPASR